MSFSFLRTSSSVRSRAISISSAARRREFRLRPHCRGSCFLNVMLWNRFGQSLARAWRHQSLRAPCGHTTAPSKASPLRAVASPLSVHASAPRRPFGGSIPLVLGIDPELDSLSSSAAPAAHLSPSLNVRFEVEFLTIPAQRRSDFKFTIKLQLDALYGARPGGVCLAALDRRMR